jgi:hypothetical protein
MLQGEALIDKVLGGWSATGSNGLAPGKRLSETETLSLLRERKRLGHLQHGMMVFFVGELTRYPPSLTRIELYRDQIRLNDAKAARLATANSYLGFTLCEQSPSDTLSPVLLKHPKVINPLLVRYCHPENLRIRCCYPCQRPVLVFELQGDRIRSKRSLNVSVATTSIRTRTESYSWGCGRRIATSMGTHLS